MIYGNFGIFMYKHCSAEDTTVGNIDVCFETLVTILKGISMPEFIFNPSIESNRVLKLII